MKFETLSSTLLMLVQVSVVFSLVVRISDGKDAQLGQFPYQASIQWGLPPFIPMKHVCAGSIIKEQWILTAGHCITSSASFQKNKVKVGVYDITVNDEFVQSHDIAKIILHENYPGGIAPNDIALLKLKTSITFNERVSPVKLPLEGSIHLGDAVLSGWGANCKKCYLNFKHILQTTTLPIVTNEVCQEAVKGVIDSGFVYQNQLCTITQDGSNTCPGDSGGPLVQYLNGSPVQLGIVSWDVLPCGTINAPSVYTRVSAFVNWITAKIYAN